MLLLFGQRQMHLINNQDIAEASHKGMIAFHRQSGSCDQVFCCLFHDFWLAPFLIFTPFFESTLLSQYLILPRRSGQFPHDWDPRPCRKNTGSHGPYNLSADARHPHQLRATCSCQSASPMFCQCCLNYAWDSIDSFVM